MGRADIRPQVVDLLKLEAPLAAAGIVTCEDLLHLGGYELSGLDWDLPAGASVKVEILQSNLQDGPFAKWTTPSLAGDVLTNDITLTTQRDGTRLNLSPSDFAQVRITNTGGAPLPITAKVRAILI